MARHSFIELENANVAEVIGDGIGFIDTLTQYPRTLLDRAFEDDFLRRALRFHHVGLLAPACTHGEMLSSIESHAYKVMAVFPSSVVASEFSRRFGRSVSVDIYRAGRMNEDVPTLELFRVVDGLGPMDIHAAMPDVMHVAYSPGGIVDAPALITRMVADGFECAGGGVNPDDTTLHSDGVTVLYFRKRQLATDVPKIELVLDGIHAPAPIRHSARCESSSRLEGEPNCIATPWLNEAEAMLTST